MINEYIAKIPLDVILIIFGFAVRHFIPSIAAGKESQNLIKYIKKREMTKDQQQELEANLGETRLWVELHTKSCPHVSQAVNDAKEDCRKIFNNQIKKEDKMPDEPVDTEAGKGN